MSTKTRPVGVTILAVLEIISGIVGVVGGLFLASFSGMMDMDFLGAMAGVVGGVLVALGLASFVLAWGLLQGKSWAWTLTLILTIIAVIFDLPSLNVIGLIIEAIILYYLFRPHVKAYFGKGEMVL